MMGMIGRYMGDAWVEGEDFSGLPPFFNYLGYGTAMARVQCLYIGNFSAPYPSKVPRYLDKATRTTKSHVTHGGSHRGSAEVRA